MSSLPSRRPRDWALRLGGLLVAAVVQACGVAPVQEAAPARPPTAASVQLVDPVIARDRDFVVVWANRGDDFRTLAERYLGDPRKAWWISDFNGVSRVEPGQEVVIPLRPWNAVGVYGNGYQTVPILCYHRFGTGRSKLVVTPGAFDAQMEYLARNGYRVIPLSQLMGFLQGKEPLPRRAVVITIDDGYRSTHEIAYPILRKHGYPATVFLYSNFVGAADAMTWPQMQELMRSGLVDVQPHSKTHGNLALKQPGESEQQYRERVRQEVEAPSSAIQQRLGIRSYSFAYPYGDTNENVIDQLGQIGVRLGLTVTPGGNAFFANPMMLRRTMVFGDDDIEAFRSKLTVFSKFASQ